MKKIRVTTNDVGGIDAAVCGEVRLHEDNTAFAHNIALLTPGRKVFTTCEGIAYGKGVIEEIVERGPWSVVVWKKFKTVEPFPKTAPHGRHYADFCNQPRRRAAPAVAFARCAAGHLRLTRRRRFSRPARQRLRRSPRTT